MPRVKVFLVERAGGAKGLGLECARCVCRTLGKLLWLQQEESRRKRGRGQAEHVRRTSHGKNVQNLREIGSHQKPF